MVVHITVGTDIVCIHRFQEFARDISYPVNKKIFTMNELDYCFSKDAVEPHLAARFAGKEAMIKALYSRDIHDVWYIDIEILNKKNGVPIAKIKKNEYKYLRVELSLAHCEDKALAFVVIIGDD